MEKNASKLGFMVFTVSALGVTLGHYWEDWVMSYLLMAVLSGAIGLIISEEGF